MKITLKALAAFLHLGHELSDFLRGNTIKYRGKGRGSPNRRYGNKAGKYLPHQNERECAPRRGA